MAWVGVITDAGRAVYEQTLSGNVLNISSLKLGKGTVDPSDMRGLTALDDEVTTGVIESMTPVSNGAQFRLRANAAPSEVGSYTLKEMGMFATVVVNNVETEVLFAYCMDTTGVGIPSEASFPDFMFILTATLILDNTTELSFTIDPSSFVSYTQFTEEQERVNTALAGKKDKQTPVTDPASSGIGNSFIASLTQDENGVVVVTRKTVQSMTGATSSAAGTGGLVPAPVAGKQDSFLRGDGQWVVPTDTKYNVFTGATASTAGTTGLVPAPAAGDQAKFLRADKTWAVPTNTTYNVFTGATANAAGTSGLVPAPAAGKNSSFLMGDGTWAVPTNTTYSAGTGISLNGTTFSLATSGVTAGSYGPSANVDGTNGTTINIPYITVDSYGRVTSIANKVLTNRDTNTTYSDFTGATASAAGAHGLVPAPAKGDQAKFLRADKTWAVPTNTTYSAGTGLTLSSGAFSLATSGVTAGSYGPSTNVDGTNGATINIPYITVDKYGRVTSIANKVLTNRDTNTTYSVFTGASASAAGSTGLVPAPAKGDQAKFLRADKTWAVPTNTTYGNYGGCSASAGGSAGLVNAPTAGQQYHVLHGAGGWASLQNLLNATQACGFSNYNGGYQKIQFRYGYITERESNRDYSEPYVAPFPTATIIVLVVDTKKFQATDRMTVMDWDKNGFTYNMYSNSGTNLNFCYLAVGY